MFIKNNVKSIGDWGRGISRVITMCCLWGGLVASSAWAGIVVTDTTATPKNTEKITSVIPSRAQWGGDSVAGIYLTGSATGSFLNEGDILLNEPTRSGVLSGIDNASNATVVNAGDITLTERASHAEATKNTRFAIGISSPFGTIVNSGNVTVTVDMGEQRSTTEDALSSVNAIVGLYSNVGVNNYGEIRLNYTGGVVESTVGNAFSALGEVYGVIGNNGLTSNSNVVWINLDAGKAIAPQGQASIDWSRWWPIYGLYSIGSGVENYSNIVINTKGGVARGRTAFVSDYTVKGISADSDVTNHAPINITATAGRAIASGVVTDSNVTVYGIEMNGSGTLASTAPISVLAQTYSGVKLDTAKQVYVSSGTTSITDYAMAFGGSAADMNSVYKGTIGVSGGATAKFTFATLHAYLGKNFQAGTYEIPMLVDGTASTPRDQFVAVKENILDFSAKLVSGGGSGLQKIVFTYEPKASAPALAVRAAADVHATTQNIVSSNLTSLLFADAKTSVTAGIQGDPSTMVASSDPSVLPYISKTTDQNNSVFIRPVVVRSSDSSSYGYDAKTAGLTFGYTRQLNDDLFLGAHAGYTNSSVDYTGTGVDERSTDIDTYYVGLHTLYRYTPNWIFTGISSFYLSNNDYRDEAPMQQEDADYKSYAIRTEVTGGYLFALGKNNFYPEVGLTHSWQHSESYTTHSDVTYETTYGTMDDHELYLSGRLKWFRDFKIGNGWTVTPLVGVGVTQALLDGDITNTMSVGSSSQLVVDEGDDTTITPEFNLTLTQENLSFILGYNGGYSTDLQNSMFWFQASLDF